MDVRSWNFFISRYNPRLNMKKISSWYVHFWFFYNFSKIGAEIFFTFRQRLYLEVKKNFSSVRPFLIFLQFFKNCVHSHLNIHTVERRVVSLRSSTEDFSIPALCEVGRDSSWLVARCGSVACSHRSVTIRVEMRALSQCFCAKY